MISNRKSGISLLLAAAITITGMSLAQADDNNHHARLNGSAKWQQNAHQNNHQNNNEDHDRNRGDWNHRNDNNRFEAQQKARIEAARKAQLEAQARERARLKAAEAARRREKDRLEAARRREQDRLEALQRQRRAEAQRLAQLRRDQQRINARFEARQRDALRDMIYARGNYGNVLDARTRAELRAFRSLPPGIQNRLLSGKSLPPGIAKQVTYLPTNVNSYLGYPDYYRVGAYGDDYFLYNTQTNTVVDILRNLLGNTVANSGYFGY